MRVAVFSTKSYDREFLGAMNEEFGHEIDFFEAPLNSETVPLAEGYPAVCAFVNDELCKETVCRLNKGGTQLIALRSAGFNNVDVESAAKCGVTIARVPAYSPNAVAEHTVALMLMLNRKIHRAYQRVAEHNFSLEGLMGFDMFGKTVGIVGTGKIGVTVAQILNGFGCKLIAYDPYPNDDARKLMTYVELDELLSQSDIITLHCPLTPETHHLIDAAAIDKMKDGVMLINTSRGAVIKTSDLIEALKERKFSHVGLDVYEEEEGVFFRDLSSDIIEDDQLARLLSFRNVVITSHQAFFTIEALKSIARTTLENIRDFERGTLADNRIVKREDVRD
jgi:D-lactate dehydrogenase